MLFVFFLVYYKWNKLDLVDLSVVVVCLYFPVYATIDLLIHNYPSYDVISAILSISLPMIAVILPWVTLNFILPKFKIDILSNLKISNITNIAKTTKSSVVVVLFSAIVLLEVYLLVKYGLSYFYDKSYFISLGAHPSKWFINLIIFFTTFVLIGTVFFAAKAHNTTGWKKVLLYGCIFVLFLIAMIHGRRQLFNSMLIVFLIINHDRKLFSWPTIAYGLIFLILFIFMFNFYQATREIFIYKVGKESLSSIFIHNGRRKFFSANPTLQNLHTRPAMWKLNYLIIKNQIYGTSKYMLPGEIGYRSMFNCVPRLFWPHKKMYDPVQAVCFKEGLPADDYNWNLFAFAQSDFGFASPVLMGFLATFAFMLLSGILKLTESAPSFFVVIVGFVTYYLFWVNQAYEAIFYLARNLIIIFLFCFIFYIIRSVYKILIEFKYNKIV